MRGPLLPQAWRQLIDVMNLVDGYALIGVVQGLVVEVGVSVALCAHHFLDTFVAPARPTVRREHHLGFLTELVQRVVDLLRPVQGVAHRGAAQRIDVVNRAGDVLRCPEGFELREVGVHLDRCLGVRRVLEHHLHAVKRQLLEILGDDEVRRNQPDIAVRYVLANRLVHMAERAACQQHGVLVLGAPRHGIAGKHVLGYRSL